MESVKIELVDIFNKLEKNENNTEYKKKYILLKKIYQKINMNNNLLIKLNQEIDNNKNTLYNLKIFNQTSFKELYETLEEEDKKYIINKFDNIQGKIVKILFEPEKKEHECSDNCNHGFDPNDIMNSNKMKKILNNKKLRNNLEHQLRKTTGMKNSSLEEILKSNIPKEQQKMVDTILKNETVKKISETFLNKDNLLKIKNIFMKLIEEPEMKEQLDKFRCIINEDDFITSLTDIYNDFQKTKDLKQIEKLVTENKKLQDVLKKVEESFKNDTINLDNIKTIVEKFVKNFITEVKELNLIGESDINNLKNLGNQFQMIKNFLGNDKKTLTKEEKKDKENKRRERARKDYRRKLRRQYKKNKKN